MQFNVKSTFRTSVTTGKEHKAKESKAFHSKITIYYRFNNIHVELNRLEEKGEN